MSKWLSGGKAKKENIRSATIKLKVFNKRLLRQVKKLEMSAKLARDKAVRLRREGDMEGSKFQAKTYLQVKNQARAVDIFRTNLENLLFKMEQATAIKDVAGIIKGIAQSVSSLKNQLSVPQLTEMMSNLDLDISDFEITQSIATEGIENINIDTEVTDDQVNNVLGEIDAEIQIETGSALPSAAGSSQKIKELEEELNRLRSNY
ncbi:MAG: Snf7 family protein [Promethearchaeota archaeon]